MLDAAYECKARFPYVVSVQIDRFDRINWVYMERAAPPQRDEFSACYQERLREKARSAPVQEASTGSPPDVAPGDRADAPMWKPGYEWSFRWERPGRSGTFVWRVDREETLEGVQCYVVRSGGRELFFHKHDLALFREMLRGLIDIDWRHALKNLAWPLYGGKAWEQLLTWERPQDRRTGVLLRTSRVERVEVIAVPAGTFRTFKVVSRNKWSDTIALETWYSDEVKQNVRIRIHHGPADVETRELMAFKLESQVGRAGSIQVLRKPG